MAGWLWLALSKGDTAVLCALHPVCSQLHSVLPLFQGKIDNAHLAHADSFIMSNRGGAQAELCQELARMHNIAVDFPKVGHNCVPYLSGR
jgi:hypothetical protein